MAIVPFALARALVRRTANSPITLLSFHSGRDETVSGACRVLERWIVRSFDRITVDNRRTREVLEREHGKAVAALSMRLPRDVEGRALPVRKDDRLIASVGRLVPVKGYLELLAEWVRRGAALRDYSLILLGEDPVRSKLGDFVPGNGLAGRVSLLANPSRDLIPQTWSEAGYYFQPSLIPPDGKTEGFGLGAVEALHAVDVPYMGCTVVVSAVGGVPEVAGDAGYVRANAGEMLEGVLDGRIRPSDPVQCGGHARRGPDSWRAPGGASVPRVGDSVTGRRPRGGARAAGGGPKLPRR